MSDWDESRFFVASDGTKIHFRDAGGQGEPVLFLHGFTASIAGQWGQPGLIAGIRDAGWRTIAFDLRGHGLSDKPHDRAAYANARMGHDAIELLDHLAIARAHILGYSLGAHIILHWLSTGDASRAASLTLGGAAGRWNWTEDETRAVHDEADELETGSIKNHILRLWSPAKPLPDAANLQALSDRKLEGMDALALAAIKRAMPDHQLTPAQVNGLTMPMLGVVGTLDPQLGPFREMKRFHPALALVEVEGAGHGDCPGKPATLAAVLNFLGAQTGRAA